MKTITWENNQLILLDQTKLPITEEYIVCNDYTRVADAIKKLEVRGAPAIGAAAAYGLLLGAINLEKQELSFIDFRAQLQDVKTHLYSTRPTAVNLHAALDKMIYAANAALDVEDTISILTKTAHSIFADDVQANQKIGEYGATLLSPASNILTHCNAGSLATCGIGTALGVVRVAHAQGKISMVYADETRPLLQGARLTAYELAADDIPVTVITDNMAAWTMKTKNIHAVIVGADRIAANVDTANKIGTYGVAIAAAKHNIPFYIAAPLSTFDFNIACGELIPIEERHMSEVKNWQGVPTTPQHIRAYNPAFDVTPHELITAIITEHGIIHRPNKEIMLEFSINLKKQGAI